MPRFSVVVPAYNASATLPETLDSMLAQEFASWECVVVDDGSTDSTASIIETYVERDSRFKLVRQENRGTAGAYRSGIAAARADLLAICAADDMLLPGHLLVMDELATRCPGYHIYSCNGEFLYHESGERKVVYSEGEWLAEHSMSFEDVIARCFFSVGAAFRRESYDRVGGHRPGVYVDDYDLWLRMMARGAQHLYTPEVLAVHRLSSFQQTARLGRVFESNIEVYRHLIGEGLLTEGQCAAAERSIAENERMIEELVVAPAMEQRSRELRESVEKRVGRRAAVAVMALVHTVSWIARPFRKRAARRAGAR